MTKSLRPGKVFIDWSQNVYYKTTVCVYSLRAKRDEPYVSVPLTWDELQRFWKAGKADRFYFSPSQTLGRVSRLGDIFEAVLILKQKLPSDGLARVTNGRASVSPRPAVQGRAKNETRFERASGIVRTLPQEKVGFVQPMQPELVANLPEGADWQYEVKWDGYRSIAVKEGEIVVLYSRNQNRLNERYPTIVAQIKKLNCKRAVIDGEIVAIDAKGRPSFQLLQNISTKKQGTVVFVAFDLLNFDGRSLLDRPLTDRQSLLAQISQNTEIQRSEPLDADLATAASAIRDLGYEGIVAKQRSSKYQPGQRGRTWFKLRISQNQEFVIGGFVKGDPFYALLLGVYQSRKLHYVGKAKAGFTPAWRRAIYAELEPLIVRKCPFVNLPQRTSGRWGEGLTQEKMEKCVWIKPRLVAQISFVEWTDGGQLRHPTFLGLRTDKPAREVIRE